MTIAGPGADLLAISGNGNSRVFIVTSNSTVTITGVTIQDGNGGASDGGGIQVSLANTLTLKSCVVYSNTARDGAGIWSDDSSGILILDDCTVYSNTATRSAAGIGSGGTLTITNSTICSNTAGSTGNGGGVFVTGGRGTLSNSTVHGNSATDGAGIYNNPGSTLILDSCAVYSNTAASDGGGIGSRGALIVNNCAIYSNTASTGVGGGLLGIGPLTMTNSAIYNNTANVAGGGLVVGPDPATLVNNTVSGNSTGGPGGGIYHQGGVLSLINVTIAGNTADSDDSGSPDDGGGLCTVGAAVVTNTIIARNQMYSSPNDCWGPLTSGGYNLVESDSPEANACGFAATGDITGTNPLLGSLADNGGATWTRALLVGSPAINEIPNGTNGCGTTLTADQRSVLRPQPPGGACDIGAYEASPVITLAKSGPIWANAGAPITYTLRVTNTSAVTATGVVLTDALPASSSFTWASDGGSEGGGTVSWPAFDIPPGGSAVARTFTVTATETITNADYRATAQGVQGVAGAVAVGTYVNHAPVAEAGDPQTVKPGAPVTLNGSGSSDADGHALAYGWAQTGETVVALSDPTAVSPTFDAPTTPEVLTFTLTITDTYSATDSDTTTVTVEPYRVYLPLALRNSP